MFFELRQYRMKQGQRDAWVQCMIEEIIPFQVSIRDFQAYFDSCSPLCGACGMIGSLCAV